jgi:hypothetical protein
VCKRFEGNLKVRERINIQLGNTKGIRRKVARKRNRQEADSPCDASLYSQVSNQPSFG